MTKISGISLTETDLDNVAYLEGERGDGSSVKIPRSLLLVDLPEILLDEQVVSGVSSVIFGSSLITDTYPAYKIRVRGLVMSTTATLSVQLSPDNGSTWRATGYVGTNTINQVNGTFAAKQTAATTGLPFLPNTSNDATYPAHAEVMIHNLRSATAKKLSEHVFV